MLTTGEIIFMFGLLLTIIFESNSVFNILYELKLIRALSSILLKFILIVITQHATFIFRPTLTYPRT